MVWLKKKNDIGKVHEKLIPFFFKIGMQTKMSTHDLLS